MTTRRTFLAALLAAGAMPRLGWAAVGNPAYLAAAQEADGTFALFGLTEGGIETFRISLPARGHAGAGHPVRAEAVAFARRPGTFARVIDCATGRVIRDLTPPPGRQFNGHGVYDPSGAVLFTSEQDAATSDGVIGVWDVAAGYVRRAAFPSGGIGPHDLRLMPDGATLVVANGGIATDPTDRTKLNIATMRPNLSYLALDGTLLERVELRPDLAQNSIRHLAVRTDGLTGFAMQWEGEAGIVTPLLGLHRRGTDLVLALAPEADEIAMQGYAGSIAFDGAGAEVAISSPRGGRVHRFDDTGAFLGAVSRSDVCGLAARTGGLLASDGLGGLVAIANGTARPLGHADRAWDNHIVTLPKV
ncbi:hypothetical protein SAMN04488003_10681 [Loktanella fryxellensis]|uniref:Twin-arginine translocation pathway signal n=1 Tax=Loktanella fryxellensis TaxID=245187 RepID=A0A1H8C6T7_9RHOB|nr:DUF1513 domain-containing protein [Loktanella fryxellensis]SEM90692.1 hypothetical protein SAMN04488003_10681 [Loktanella fryxellensis]